MTPVLNNEGDNIIITRVQLGYPRIALQNIQVAAACFIVDLNISYTVGMLQSGNPLGACYSAKVIVENAIDAYIFRAGILGWSDDMCHKWRLEKLKAIVGEESQIYSESERLLSYPRDLDPDVAHAYFEDCLNFAVKTIGIRDMGIPGGQIGTDRGLEPRYEFVREWGRQIVDFGMTSAFLPLSLAAIIHGGRGPLQPTIE